MYVYKNKRSGAVIRTASPCQGGDWVKLEERPTEQTANKPSARRTAKPKGAAT